MIDAKDLGIELKKDTDTQVFKWLIACQLFGARISQEMAARTFTELDRAGVLTPQKLADADWQHLVELLGAGDYGRYDESTARELIAIGKYVLERYDGDIRRLRDGAERKKDLFARLEEFAGVGPKSAEIFLRDMAPVWNSTAKG